MVREDTLHLPLRQGVGAGAPLCVVLHDCRQCIKGHPLRPAIRYKAAAAENRPGPVSKKYYLNISKIENDRWEANGRLTFFQLSISVFQCP